MQSEAKNYYVASIDGKECKDVKSFLINIGRSFNFPAYYGINTNALLECLNDLSWINETNYIIKIANYKYFLIEEPDEKQSVMQSLENVAMEWKNVPNFEGEEDFRIKSDFLIITDELENTVKLTP